MIVYQLMSPSGKSYVGKTAFSLAKRFKEHCAIKTGGFAINAAIRKHGKKSFLVQELSVADTNEQASNLEKLWIILLQSYDPRKGYNETFGGDGVMQGRHLTPEHKAAISRGNSGKKFTSEHRLKISLNRRGENQVCHKLTEQQVKEIRAKHIPYKVTYAMLGRQYGVASTSIQEIIERRTWKHI